MSLTGSVAEEAALSSATETIVGVLVVRFIGDDAVVACLLWNVRNDHGSSVWHALADLRHSLVLIGLHVGHTLDSLGHVAVIIFTFVLLLSFKGIVFDHLHKSLSLATSRRLVIYTQLKSWLESSSLML